MSILCYLYATQWQFSFESIPKTYRHGLTYSNRQCTCGNCCTTQPNDNWTLKRKQKFWSNVKKINCYYYHCVSVMHQYTFLLYLVLEKNTMCQQYISHGAEVLWSDVCLQKESNSIDVQVLQSVQTAASVRQY